jgi:hypothetical protein
MQVRVVCLFALWGLIAELDPVCVCMYVCCLVSDSDPELLQHRCWCLDAHCKCICIQNDLEIGVRVVGITYMIRYTCMQVVLPSLCAWPPTI